MDQPVLFVYRGRGDEGCFASRIEPESETLLVRNDDFEPENHRLTARDLSILNLLDDGKSHRLIDLERN